MNIQVCRDTSDAVALYLPQRLYLKPFAKINISIQLPTHKVHGKSISNWELMEKLRKMIQPDSFSVLKVSKHSSELIRFDAELENRDKLERVLARLEDRIIQLNDYPDPLKVKVSEAKSDFPSRHAWDSFFRDATDMDEMKPGERPDTVHITNLPITWFVHEKDRIEDALPSENIFKKVFEKYGAIRQVDVPAADPFRMQMKVTMRGITTPAGDSGLYFDGYVQYSEYVSFVRCMDALRNKKLVRKKEDIAEWCSINVDFDKSKHMTDAAVKRRAIVRERLVTRHRAKEEDEKQEKERISKREAKERQKYERAEQEKLTQMKEREERRKKKQLAILLKKDNINISSKVAEEQQKLLRVQKKLQAVRLIEELFNRIELRPELQRNGGVWHYGAGERAARARVVHRFKQQLEGALLARRDRVHQARDGSIVIRSALETKKPRRDSSVSSLSSVEEHKKVKSERLTPEREAAYANASGMYGIPPGYGYGYPFACAAPGYPYPAPQTMYYGGRVYYPPPESYGARGAGGGGRGRAPRGWGWGARSRGRIRIPHFEGPDASHQYYKYFKRLTESKHNQHDDRDRSRSRSRSRSRRRSRSYTRSRSRSHRRHSRSRSRRSRSRRARSRRSRTRSRSRRSRSSSRSRSRSRSRGRSRSRSKSKLRSPQVNNTPKSRERSKSWSLSRQGEKEKTKSPNN